MKQSREDFIHNLESKTTEIIEFASNELCTLPTSTLKYKSAPDKWSILECLEHLNLYGDYYLPRIEQAVKESKGKQKNVYNPGWLGDYFAKSMLPKKNGTVMKMSTFKDKNPIITGSREKVLEEFINQQKRYLELIHQSESIDLEEKRIPITISKWIRLKLGDTMHFNVNHNIRHYLQAKKILGDPKLNK